MGILLDCNRIHMSIDYGWMHSFCIWNQMKGNYSCISPRFLPMGNKEKGSGRIKTFIYYLEQPIGNSFFQELRYLLLTKLLWGLPPVPEWTMPTHLQEDWKDCGSCLDLVWHYIQWWIKNMWNPSPCLLNQKLRLSLLPPYSHHV